jgi:UDP-N-acetylmuramoylalanine-D-glutamate ligase
VLPTLAALDTFGGRRIALIAGGADRGLDHRPLGEALAARTTPTLVATAHTTGPAIAAAVREAAAQRAESTTEVVECADLADAVRRAWRWARPDGVVLLSPAAASFDAFTDHRHRSRTFRDCIAGLR